MSKALIAGINQVATEKGLDREVIFEAIEAALVSAYKRNYGTMANVSAEVDRVTGEMRVYAEREVVEEIFNERTEITLEDARKEHPTSNLGDVVRVLTTPADFGRIAAQTAKQVILQRIREAERDTVYENFAHRVGEIITTQVRSVDAQSGAVSVLLDEKHEQLLLREEQIPNEKLRPRDMVKVYVVDVHKSTRGPVIKLSRTHRNLLRRLMEQEIPEVRDGVVEIKAIAREPGARSKAAVVATQPNVDAVGSCVGMRGLRIQNIVNELSGEKIDVVEWSPDMPSYISNALSPAKVNNVILDEKSSIKTAIVVVPDRQLSLAIGKEGQNARLAAKLTGWRIDIKSESEALEEGLDRMSQAQKQVLPSAKGADILSMAERYLQEGELPAAGVDSDELFSKAARALEEMEETAVESVDTYGLPSFEEMLAKADSAPKNEIPELPSLDDLPALPETPVTEEAFALDEMTMDEPPTTEAPSEVSEHLVDDITDMEELPEVITADMLRARMANRKEIDFDDEKFQIPAELLVGLDDEAEDVEEDEDEWEQSRSAAGKGKGKAKAAPARKPAKPEKKSKKKRRPAAEDFGDDFY